MPKIKTENSILILGKGANVMTTLTGNVCIKIRIRENNSIPICLYHVCQVESLSYSVDPRYSIKDRRCKILEIELATALKFLGLKEL
jgi:hypothetical protein